MTNSPHHLVESEAKTPTQSHGLCTMTLSSLITLAVSAALLLSRSSPAIGEQQFVLPDNPYALDANRACGPICLSFLAAFYGNDPSCGRVAEICPPGPEGASLEQLQKAASQLGYHTLAVHLEADQLERLRYPAILHLRNPAGRDHFVVWLRWDSAGGRGIVFSPPYRLDRVPIASLAQRFSGRAIIVSQVHDLDPEAVLAPRRFKLTATLRYPAFVLFIVFLWILFRRFYRRRSIHVLSPAASKTVCAACFAVVLIGCSASEPPEARHVDKGEVKQGTKVVHVFRIRNFGQKPLRVKKIEKSCKCQIVELDLDRDTPPNEVLPVTLEVPTEGILGQVTNRIVIETDADVPELQKIGLSLVATVVAKVRSIPSRLQSGNIDSGDQTTKRLRIESSIPGVLDHYVKPSSDNAFLSAELVDKQAGTLLFDITFDETAPPGDIVGTIAFHFDHPEYPCIETKVSGRKVGKIRVIPSRISMSSAASREGSTRMRLQSVNQTAFQIIDIDTPDNVTLDWDTNLIPKERLSHELRVSWDTSQPQKSTKYIVVRTTQAECPLLKIPIVPE